MKQTIGALSSLIILTLYACHNKLPTSQYAKQTSFQIFGSINEDYIGLVHLAYSQSPNLLDTIHTRVNKGQFSFASTASFPAYARLYLDQHSLIPDFYIDSTTTKMYCTNDTRINKWTNGYRDTFHYLQIDSIIGSKAEYTKVRFETLERQLDTAALSLEEKQKIFYNQLKTHIEVHPKSRVSAYILNKATLLNSEQAQELLTSLDTSLQKVPEWEPLTRKVIDMQRKENRTLGLSFKDVALKDTSGNLIAMKQFKGKYVLVDFWASWCGPCRAQKPKLKELYAKYQNKGFEIVGITLDTDESKWKKAIIKDALIWPQIMDTNGHDGEISKYYFVQAIPFQILLDKEGRLLEVNPTLGIVEDILSTALSSN